MRAAGPLLLVALLLVPLPLAGAHAALATAHPPPGGHVDEGLTLIELVFTEDVERGYTSANLIDENGTSLATGPVQFDDERRNVIRLPVQPLRSGVYSASWQALSADTHTTRGAFVFSVGTATLRPGLYSPQPSDPADYDTREVVRDGAIRFAFYTGLFLVVGAPLFALVVLRDAPPRALFSTATSFGLVGATAAGLALLLFARETGLGAGALGTSSGTSLLWRGLFLAGAAGLCALAAWRPSAWRAASVGAIVVGALALASTALGSHAAALRERTAFYIAADAVHLAAAAVWIGGIVGFLHVAIARQEGRALAPLIFRFTYLAVPSVGLILLTGFAASLAHIPCVEDGPDACRAAAPEEPYMQLVAAKLLLMVPLVAMGAYNALRVRPAVEGGSWSAARFRRVVQAEAVLLAIVVAAAGALAASPPPDREMQTPASPPPALFEAQNHTAKSHLILQIEPNPVTLGTQKLIVIVHPLGTTLPNSTLVALKVYPATAEEPEEKLEPTKVTPNEWEIEGSLFSTAETWKVMVILQRPDEYAKVVFDVPVVNPTSPTAS